jgi:GAF domain-containing protein/signal transduction histidine kinase
MTPSSRPPVAQLVGPAPEQSLPRPDSRPGYLGPVPFLLVLRVLVAAGIVLRFAMHGGIGGHTVIAGLLFGAFCSATALAVAYRDRSEKLSEVRYVWMAVVGLDIALVSGCYWLTANPQSDFFLFFYLPLFTAAEYLGGRDQVGGRYVVWTFLVSSVVFLVLILGMGMGGSRGGLGATELFVRVFLPREVFFLAASAILAFRLHREVATTSERTLLLSALREVGAATPGVVSLHEQLEAMLDRLVNDCGFEYATIALVDDYERKIRAVRGRNVPPGWLARAIHDLDSDDIQAYVVKTKETVVSDSEDCRFDTELWTRYNHARLARVFAPLVSRGKVIGTLEAGSQKEKLLDVRANSDAVTQLGQAKGPDIERVLPHALLELVAEHAMQLVGAGSATLHVLEDGQALLCAGAGRVNREFLQQHQPSADGMGHAAMTTGKVQLAYQLPESKRSLIDAGIRSMAAYPLSLQNNIRGVLYLHYWDEPHHFTEAEVELVKAFVPQMEVAIQNHLVFRQISRGAEEAATVTGLTNVIRALSEKPPADEELAVERFFSALAENVLYMLDAKNVTLYEYGAQPGAFVPRAVKGAFKEPSVMQTQVRPADVVYQAVQNGRSLFIADMSKDPAAAFLKGPRKDGIDRHRFVIREGIESCIVLVLRSPYNNEVVGCMFANYTAPYFEGNDSKPFRALATSLASAVAMAIKTRQLYKQDLLDSKAGVAETKRELDALRVVDRAIVASAAKPDLKAIYDVLLGQARATLNADAGDVTIWEPEAERLRIVTAQGYPGESPETLSKRVALGMGIVGWVAKTREAFRTGNVATLQLQAPDGTPSDGPGPAYRRVHPDTHSEIAVPILDGSVLMGVINLERRDVDAFTERHERFLKTLAVQGAIAIHSVRQYAKFRQQLGQGAVLGRIGERLLRAGNRSKHELDVILRLILTGLTSGEGLGFSRAFVFLAEPQSPVLHGKMAVGALEKEEADGVWDTLKERASAVAASGGDFLQLQLDEAQMTAERVYAKPDSDIPLSLEVRKLTLPIGLTGKVQESFATKEPFVLQGNEDDPLREVLAPLYENAPACAMAGIPITFGEEQAGLIVLDRRFIFDEGILDGDCRHMLGAFARSANLSFESFRLRDRLASHQQLENWRRAADDVAHTLRTRLRRITAEVTRAEELAHLSRSEQAKLALSTRVKGSLAAAERLVAATLRLARPVVLTEGVASLSSVLPRVVEENKHVCKLVATDLSDIVGTRLPNVLGDPDAIYDMLSELVYNADRELRIAGTPNPVVRIAVFPSEDGVRIEISDNGPGVPPDMVATLFDRGVSSSEGSGLGLAIARRQAREQAGDIVYQSAEPTGACFVVTLKTATAVRGAA